jgi:hypothetical protein
MFYRTKKLRTTCLLHLANYIPIPPFLYITLFSLFILLHLQKCLIMGKPMGRHPITCLKTLMKPMLVPQRPQNK